MVRNANVSCISFLIFCGLLNAQEWWESKPHIQWSAEEVQKILVESPWARRVSAGRRRAAYDFRTTNSVYQTGAWVPAIYQVQILTAKPVQAAWLRRISLDPGVSLSTKDWGKSDTEKEQERIRNFIAMNPESCLVKENAEYIIVSVIVTILALAISPLDEEIWVEVQRDNELSGIDASKLISGTSLRTNTGKRIKIDHYEPPGKDKLGAKLFFKRKLPDGTPFIADDDKELRFETRLGERKVKVKFDLTKMMYQGVLEY